MTARPCSLRFQFPRKYRRLERVRPAPREPTARAQTHPATPSLTVTAPRTPRVNTLDLPGNTLLDPGLAEDTQTKARDLRAANGAARS